MTSKTIALISSILFLSACSEGSVQLSAEHWQCQAKNCESSFVLKNNSTQTITAYYAVRAQSAIQTIGTDMSKGLVVAEIKDNVELQAGESQTILHQFDAARPPTNVSFKAWTK